ncbi:LysR family transcriptional regulator [Peptoniphilus gorbachii]|uniref:DNA-binding transcriptional LysR family regulator n=1 Tax=Peptoniphilus gorbachii TaxID=411567 RepID=A0ABS2MLP8_9FIRM|nr:LysR family transcriptional regulator [Peptoniphilus gorbachii]MBM7550953.1 DNA-binding transcriptional LysR family regulator [Peptoniphilus gorbachii]MBS5946074.1 LysR family transcriptional regulator [Peptoniphilus harei]MDU6783147.1 LysR family transcriptional regulator [Peptoniphilus harei]
MTIRDLEIFIEVVKAKNMSNAAKNLEISQPTVSHAISQIENEYNVKLFDRVSKKLYITDVGLRLYDFAQNILEQFEETVIFLQSSSTAHNINLGVSSNFSSQFLLEIIDEYEEKKDDVSIRVYVDSREKIIQKLNAGIINLAILDGDIGVENNSAEPFFEDEIFIISSKNSSINDKDVLEAEDLKNKKFVLGDLDDYSKKILLNYLREKSIPIDLKFICQNKDMVLNIVKNTDALSIGASSTFSDNELVKHRLSDISIKRTYYLVYHNDAFLKKNLKNFVNFVKNKFSKK